ncbi:hypothetical protein [Erythrobacter phage vB_EliS-L02]|nr:hypothetical protein [Erythrobacter phage vB_EliS-L02]
MRVTYEIVTPESAEHGDAEERGFVLPASGFHLLVPLDEVDDFEDHELVWDLADAEQWLGRESMEDCGRWFTSIDGQVDYATGAETRYSLHPSDKTTPASYERLARIFCWRPPARKQA